MNPTLRIAIADDEPDMRDYFQDVLPRLGHTVVAVAENGRELVEKCRTAQPDLVITDIKMPELDGIDAAIQVYHERPVPVILVSAHHDAALIERAEMDNIMSYLVKPIKQAELAPTIAIAVHRFENFMTMRQEAADLRQALADSKVTERAKGIQMKKGKLDEPEAEELRQRTRELEDAARHKDEFLGMLAHELRNPLGTICNAVQVLKQFGSPDPHLQWAQDVIGRQADHMAHLVEDLLDASRIAYGKVRIQKKPVDLSQVVGQAVEICRPLLSARKQQVTVSLPSRPVPLLADPTRLIQVLTNLLNNAAKYTEEGGHICLTAAEEEGEVVVRVRDNGIGIGAEMLPHVFDLFTQVPGALDRSEGGLGIGLAMVSHLIQLHGGTVQAFSEGPGQGSEFVVRLPLLSATCARRDGAGETGHLPA